jgi:hypothetical protein
MIVFKKDLLLIDQTNYVQFVVYYFAEHSKNSTKYFVTLMLTELTDKMESKANRKILTSLSNYLCSYVDSSVCLTPSTISKTLKCLMNMINA